MPVILPKTMKWTVPCPFHEFHHIYFTTSAEIAGNVTNGSFFLRIFENLLRISLFHHFAKVEEGGFISDTLGLLHVMGNHDHRVIFLQLHSQFFDMGGGNGVQGGGGLVHEEYFRFYCQSAGNAETLLLTAGKT